MEPSDADDVFTSASMSVSELSRWLPWCQPGYQREQTAEFAQVQPQVWASGQEFSFVIQDAKSGDLIGGAGLKAIEIDFGCAETGYWVRTDRAARGIATRSIRLLAGWAFEALDLIRIQIIMSVENLPSQRVAEKVGAVREAKLRQRMRIQGRLHDAYLYALFPEHLSDLTDG